MKVEDDFSCIKEVTRVVRIALPSVYISNEIAGVSDILESWKRQYVPQLQSVVVSYKNVSLASKSGFFAIDKPFVHYDVKATFELFCPTIGNIVKGKINRVSHDYIGCLVHNTINVAIKRSVNASVGLSKFISLDHMILLKITCFDFHRKVIRVKGEITEECVHLMKELSPFNSQKDVFQDSQSSCLSTSDLSEDTSGFDTLIENNDSQFEDPGLLESPSLLEPKYTIQNNNFNVDNLDDRAPSTSQESESSSLVHKRKKKSKKQKILEKQNCETDIEESMKIDESADIFKSPKKKKKHKDKKSKDTYSSEIVSPSKMTIDSKLSKSPSKKKSRKDEYITHYNLLDSTTSGIETADEMKSPHTPKKKKYAQSVSRNDELSSPKSLGHVSSNVSNKFLTDISIKKEMLTDSEFCSPSPKKKKFKTDNEFCSPSPKKSKKQKHNLMEDKSLSNITSNDIDGMMNAFSAFEPCLDQLLIPQSSDDFKEEPTESDNKEKKRKRKSSGKEGHPSKKEKIKDHDVVIKSEEKCNKKSKNKKKDKSHKKSKNKKDNEKISEEGSKEKKKKNKLLKSKKDKLAYKIKAKKIKKTDKKSKSKKKKSSKKKTS